MAGLLLALAGTSFSNNYTNVPTSLHTGGCDGDTDFHTKTFALVGYVANHETPSGWWINSWVRDSLSELPAGSLLLLRENRSGNLTRVYLQFDSNTFPSLEDLRESAPLELCQTNESATAYSNLGATPVRMVTAPEE